MSPARKASSARRIVVVVATRRAAAATAMLCVHKSRGAKVAESGRPWNTRVRLAAIAMFLMLARPTRATAR